MSLVLYLPVFIHSLVLATFLFIAVATLIALSYVSLSLFRPGTVAPLFWCNRETKFFCLVRRRIRKLYDFILLFVRPKNFVFPFLRNNHRRDISLQIARVQLAVASRKPTQTWEACRACVSLPRNIETADFRSGLPVRNRSEYF